MTWLSMKPPCVGSGCSVTRVATGSPVGRHGELADQREPVGGVQVTGVRVAGSTVAARISSGPP